MSLRGASIGLLSALAVAALPATASAASAGVNSGVLTYEAGAGELNQVGLGYSDGSYVVTDSGAVIAPGPGCTISEQGHKATCDGATTIVANLADRGDSAVSYLLFTPVTIDGGDGNDTLTTSSSPDKLLGGSGDDTLNGGWGDDILTGGPGADALDGGAGSDKIFARDGELDTIVCGYGTDSGERDAEDTAAADCESVVPPGVELPVEEPATTDDGIIADPGPAVTEPVGAVVPVVLRQAPRANPRGAIPVRIHCPRAASVGCVGTVSVALADEDGGANAARRRSTPKRKPSRRRFKLAAGQTKAVPVQLARRAARSLRSRGRARVKITVEVEVDGGQTLKSERVVTVRERRTANRRAVGKSRGRKSRGRRR